MHCKNCRPNTIISKKQRIKLKMSSNISQKRMNWLSNGEAKLRKGNEGYKKKNRTYYKKRLNMKMRRGE
jgi:hypothetical protein